VVLNLLHSIGNIVYNYLIISSAMGNTDGYKLFSTVFSLIYMPLADFLTVMTILYLFYFQGMQLIKHHRLSTTPKLKKKAGVDGRGHLLLKEDVESSESRADVDTVAVKNILKPSYEEGGGAELSVPMGELDGGAGKDYAVSAPSPAIVGTPDTHSPNSSSINQHA
jgi:hypothetical protein